MIFSEMLDAVRRDPAAVTIPAEWGQGRASFGGLVAALAFEAMRAKVPEGRPVRSLAITFVGPVAPDVPVSFQAEVLREGKAVSQMCIRDRTLIVQPLIRISVQASMSIASVLGCLLYTSICV